MAKMTGLGKGLDALFGPAPEEEQVQDNDMLKTLKIAEVEQDDTDDAAAGKTPQIFCFDFQ